MQTQREMKNCSLPQQVCTFLVLAIVFLVKEGNAYIAYLVSNFIMLTHGDTYGSVLILLTYLDCCQISLEKCIQRSHIIGFQALSLHSKNHWENSGIVSGKLP